MQKGISLDLGEGFVAVDDIAFALPGQKLKEGAIIRKGKKVFHKVVVS